MAATYYISSICSFHNNTMLIETRLHVITAMASITDLMYLEDFVDKRYFIVFIVIVCKS